MRIEELGLALRIEELGPALRTRTGIEGLGPALRDRDRDREAELINDHTRVE